MSILWGDFRTRSAIFLCNHLQNQQVHVLCFKIFSDLKSHVAFSIRSLSAKLYKIRYFALITFPYLSQTHLDRSDIRKAMEWSIILSPNTFLRQTFRTTSKLPSDTVSLRLKHTASVYYLERAYERFFCDLDLGCESLQWRSNSQY